MEDYVDTFEEVDEAYKKAVENGATSVLEPELDHFNYCIINIKV